MGRRRHVPSPLPCSSHGEMTATGPRTLYPCLPHSYTPHSPSTTIAVTVAVALSVPPHALAISLVLHLAPRRRQDDDDDGRPRPVWPNCPHPQSLHPRPPGGVQKRPHNARDRAHYAVAPACPRDLLGRIPAVQVWVRVRVSYARELPAPVPYPKLYRRQARSTERQGCYRCPRMPLVLLLRHSTAQCRHEHMELNRIYHLFAFLSRCRTASEARRNAETSG
jgi:hypothetical protein